MKQDAEDLIEDPGLVFRPIFKLDGSNSQQPFHERDILQIITQYYEMLPEDLRKSFAPPE